jgi:hypothetical protein
MQLGFHSKTQVSVKELASKDPNPTVVTKYQTLV